MKPTDSGNTRNCQLEPNDCRVQTTNCDKLFIHFLFTSKHTLELRC